MNKADTPKQYCKCRGTDNGQPMIRCDNCDDWFHFACVQIDNETAEDIDTFICEPCAAKSNRKTTFSWEMTDDEVSFGQRVQEASIAAKPRPKLRVQAAATTKQAPTPTIPSATPTFMADQSDSDEEMRDDDGEYTEEHQLTRIRRGRQSHQDDTLPEQSPHSERNRKRKSISTTMPAPKRKKTITARSPSPLSDPVRKYCYGKLHEVIEPIFLEYRTKDGDTAVDDDTAKNLASRYTTELESAVFNNYSEPDKKGVRSAGPKYKERFRMLTFNLGQSDRVLLRTGIGTGDISAAKLSVMSSVDLANEQTKQDMEKVAQEALHQSILKVQTSLPRAKITHKGEEIIENNASEDLQRTGEEEDQERLRLRLRVRTGSILDGTAEAATAFASAVTSSILGESSPVQLDKNTPTILDENGVASGHYPLTSPMSPITPVALANITSSPVQEVRSPTDESKMTRVGVLGPRPSFDLNALWSGNDSANGLQPRDEITVPKAGIEGDDESEVAMDLDDEVAENQDFGMFLDGVEEKSRPPSIGPPKSPQMEKESLPTLPVVWLGELVMPLDPNPALVINAAVRQVGGRPLGTSGAVWNILFKSNKALIEGRVPTDRSTKYLVTTRLNSNKELIVVTFNAAEDSKAKFDELFDFLVKKDRHGLIFPWGTRPPPSAPGKDLYLIPLKAEQSLPEFIDLLDHVQIPKERDENMLLGVFVLSKGKIVVPVIPETGAPVSQHNDVVPSLFSSALGATNMLPYGGNPAGSSALPYPMLATGGQTLPNVFPYSTPPTALPPASTGSPPVPQPPPAALSALTSLSQEQIGLILKGLSMAAANTGPAAAAPVAPPSWFTTVPPQNMPYPSATAGPPENLSPSRNYPPTRPNESPHNDNYARDRERRASPPYRGRPGRGRGRGARDRRGGPTGADYSSKPTGDGWGRRRTAASTDDY